MIENFGDKAAGGADILILSDGRPGHFNQSLGVADNLNISRRDFVEVKFKSKFFDYMLRVWCAAGTKMLDVIPGGERFLRRSLKKESFTALMRSNPELIISAGSSLAGVNLMLGDLKEAASVVCMTPSLIGTSPFDLAVVPEHDSPPAAENIIKTVGAPNRITSEYVHQAREKWEDKLSFSLQEMSSPVLGVLLGGNNAYFKFTPKICNNLLKALNEFKEETGGSLILTTSPRTPSQIEDICADDFASCDDREKFLILSAEWEMNPVPMIIDASDAVLVTEDSVSMVSEAASGCARVFVIELASRKKGVPKTHKTLEKLQQRGYIEICSVADEDSGSLKRLMMEGNKSAPEEGRLKEAERAAKIIRKKILAGG